MAKKKSKKWFIKVRGSYLPNAWQGWLTYIPFVGYLVAGFAYAAHHHSDLAGAAFFLFTQWIVAAIVMTWVAQRTS